MKKRPTREPNESGVTRREALRLTAGALLTPPLQPRATRATRFFTPAEYALADELAEQILPADEHSPGARAARAAAFIDQQLAETWDPDAKRQWREGLRRIDALSRQMTGKPFLGASADERLALLTRLARNEADPKLPEEKFFVELKTRVAFAYYTSKIGIHDELEYKGNTYLREFAGEEIRNNGRD